MPNVQEIHMYTLPVCPKCKIMKKRIQDIMKDGINISLKEFSLISNPGFVIKNKIMDAPVIVINDKVLSGVVPKEKIIELLES
jgi:hypothetical protein